MTDLEKLNSLDEVKSELHKLELSIAKVIDQLEGKTEHQIRIDRININRGALPVPDRPRIVITIDASIK